MRKPLPHTLAPIYEHLARQEAVRRPVGRVLGGLGTSFTANCHTKAATASATELYGYLFWAASGSGMWAPETENYGLGGDNSSGFLARLPAAVAGQASIILCPDFTNDHESVAIDATKRNILRIAHELMNAGKIVIFGTGSPLYGANALTATGLAHQAEIRRWLTVDMANILAVVDTFPLIKREDLIDDKHLNPIGASKFGGAFVPLIQEQRFLDFYALPTGPGDAWSATSPFGCLTPNVALTGAQSLTTSSVNPVAGSVIANLWKAAGSAMGTLSTRWYKEVNPDGTETQCIECKGTPLAGGYIAFSPTQTTVLLTSLATGDKLRMFANVKTIGKGLLSAEAELMATKSGAVNYARSGDKYQEPWTLPLLTEQNHETTQYSWDAATDTILTGRVGIFFSAVEVDAIIKIRLPGIRKF